MEEIERLVQRVEEQIGPNRHLDEEIALAFCDEHHFAQIAGAPEGVGCEMYRFGHHSFSSALRITSSVDAALAFADRVLPGFNFAVYTNGGGKGPVCLAMIDDEPVKAEVHAPTIPLAITLAAMKATLAK